MTRANVPTSLLVVLAFFMLSSSLNATHILRNDLLKREAVILIENIGTELTQKTGVNAYLLATHEHFPQKYNLVEHMKQFDANLSKPYVLFIFAPFATITEKSNARGRVGIIPSSETVRALYDYEAVRDAGIDIVAMKDSNTAEDKYNIGILQAYSELADNIAKSKGVELKNTIPDDMGTMVNILRVFVYAGTAVLLWIFVFRGLWIKFKMRKEDG